MFLHFHPELSNDVGRTRGANPGDFHGPSKKSRCRRVLVVDDEPLVRWSIAETLGADGYQVVEAGSGDSAILSLMDPPGVTDAILLDLRLPDFTDLSLLAAIRRLSPSTAIILMTAYGTPELVERAHRLGAFAVVHKPFDLDALAPLIETAVAASTTAH